MEEINKLVKQRNDMFLYYFGHNNLSLDSLMIVNDKLTKLDKRIETLLIQLKA